MDNYGSEIGQKMRSAVKAKLLELGTGYIDDELPDYVMIMVANKRSKQQMIADLNLFLDNQTELFVTWLHEVLQKLQEVTLPAGSAAAKKRKTSLKEDASAKKDKKGNKKERRTSKKHADETSEHTATETQFGSKSTAVAADAPTTTTTSAAPAAVPVINSITDVFAEDLLEKAKKTQDATTGAAANIKKGKGKKALEESDTEPQTPKLTQEPDIASVTQISSSTGSGAVPAVTVVAVSGNREKDLAELAEIQKRIYAAKKHLKELGELNEEAEVSDDNDFINLKDDGSVDELNDAGDFVQKTARPKSPIIFNAGDTNNSENFEPHQQEEEVIGTTRHRRITPPPPAPVPAKTIAAAYTSDSAAIGSRRHRSDGSQDTAPSQPDSHTRRSRERERRDVGTERKRPIHERLGVKPREPRDAPTERRTRGDKELYVPAFRRKDNDRDRQQHDRDRDRERERDHDRNKFKERERERERDRERERERERDRLSRTRERESRHRPVSREQSLTTPSMVVVPASTVESSKTGAKHAALTAIDVDGEPKRQRIGSRVVVAAAKTVVPSDDEAELAISVNSVIKIKPRPPVSPSRQACKNLLLRAVADAQRSTILAKKTTAAAKEASALKLTARLGEIVVGGGAGGDRNTKLYTKSYRDRMKRNAPAEPLLRRTAHNFVIEVEGGRRKRPRHNDHTVHALEDVPLVELEEEEEEYVPAPVLVSEQGDSEVDYEYVTEELHDASGNEQSMDEGERGVHVEYDEDGDDMEEPPIEKTQFVVTMNDDQSPTNYKKRALRHTPSPSPPPQVSSSSSVVKRNNGVSVVSAVAAASSTTSRSKSRAARRTRTRTRSRDARKRDVKSRLSLKKGAATKAAASSSSPRRAPGEGSARRTSPRRDTSQSSNTPPPLNSMRPRRTEFIEIYRKPKDIKKIIIQEDSDDELDLANKKGGSSSNTAITTIVVPDQGSSSGSCVEDRSTTPPLPPNAQLTPGKRRAPADKVDERRRPNKDEKLSTAQQQQQQQETSTSELGAPSPAKRKRTPIKFDIDSNGGSREKDRERDREREKEKERERERSGRGSGERCSTTTRSTSKGRNSRSVERERDRDRERDREQSSLERHSGEERRKISIRTAEAKKYDNIPSLSSVALDSSSLKVIKPKERCKYHPNCTKQFCDFYHPSAPCTRFPNCKYADKCMYSHPKCKYDMACSNADCTFSHSGIRNPAQLQTSAPPLSSHVVPVQNYKSISVVPASGAMCKYYPNCTKVGCTFYHPKPCRFGKNCINKLECTFYHHELQSSSKFKWVASLI